ncbi:MAG: hypothetical protein LAT82_04345 [Nanoarchaeota archaeon]|nr:hypothetical protein [Nanoarchaeota archaeon]
MIKKKKDSPQSFSIIGSLTNVAKSKVDSMIEEYIRKNVTQKLVRIGEMSLAFILGVVLLLVGISQYLASQLSFLENGLNYIVMGTILLIIAYFLS